MGAVMGAFAFASVLGVPAGLELARQGSWKLPFIAVALLGAALGTFAQAVLPPMSAHVALSRKRKLGRDLLVLLRPDILVALSTTFVVMSAGFVLIPNISAYLLGNVGYPRERLGLLYLAGGVVSFFTTRLVGRLVDRHGSALVGTIGTLMVSVVVYIGFVVFPPALPVMAIFVLFMMGMGFRNVAYNTLMSRVPHPDERARFSSMQSAVQHLAASIAAISATQMLRELPNHELEGVPVVAGTSIALGAAVVPLLWVVERRVLRPGRERRAA